MTYFVGVDVGTGSARAGVFDSKGQLLGKGAKSILLFHPEEDHVEHSSEDIWQACVTAIKEAVAQAGISPDQITGMGFDATCSLVSLDADDKPVTVSVTGRDEQNVIVWMDHRAADQTRRINLTNHAVLKYVGGGVSLEMQTPKLLWIKEQLPKAYQRAAKFFDLPDFLVYRATGNDIRSLCSTVCKWTYLGHENGFQRSFFEQIGLADLCDNEFSRIGRVVRPVGEKAGNLSEKAAKELGLTTNVSVAVSIIDAHAGGIGMLGVGAGDIEERLALIGGTSTCHMIVSREPHFVPGVWGPYWSAMVPGFWLTEGGQSATGALLDHTIFSHARGAELSAMAKEKNTTVYALLNERLDEMAKNAGVSVSSLASDLHVLPDHHGNRSPRADASLRGMVSGLKLSSTLDSLALLYLATIQGIAHGTKHILDALCENGHRPKVLVATGGDAKNPLFLREHADATGCTIVLPKEPEAVLLGSSMLGAVAAGAYATLEQAMAAMASTDKVIEPDLRAAKFHEKKHKVFLRMYEDQMAYRSLMEES